jgi:hypothetical protein
MCGSYDYPATSVPRVRAEPGSKMDHLQLRQCSMVTARLPASSLSHFWKLSWCGSRQEALDLHNISGIFLMISYATHESKCISGNISRQHDSVNLLTSRYISVALVSSTKHSPPSYLCLSIASCSSPSGSIAGTDIGGRLPPNTTSLWIRICLIRRLKCSRSRAGYSLEGSGRPHVARCAGGCEERIRVG